MIPISTDYLQGFALGIITTSLLISVILLISIDFRLKRLLQRLQEKETKD